MSNGSYSLYVFCSSLSMSFMNSALNKYCRTIHSVFDFLPVSNVPLIVNSSKHNRRYK